MIPIYIAIPFYVANIIESFCSSTFTYLKHIVPLSEIDPLIYKLKCTRPKIRWTI